MPSSEIDVATIERMHAASTGGGITEALAGTMTGAYAGTQAGMAFGMAAYGQTPTPESMGISFASAFAGALASTSLSTGYQKIAESTTSGAAGRAAGESAKRASDAVVRQNLEVETAMLGAAIDSYDADNQLACGPAMQLCARLAQMAANSPAGQAAQRMAQRYGPAIANWAKANGQQAAAVISRLADKIVPASRTASDVGARLTIQFGKDANQVYHAFRHLDKIGLDRSTVMTTVDAHLRSVASQIMPGQPLNQVITIAGQKIQYTAFQIADGVVNVGRMHPVP